MYLAVSKILIDSAHLINNYIDIYGIYRVYGHLSKDLHLACGTPPLACEMTSDFLFAQKTII